MKCPICNWETEKIYTIKSANGKILHFEGCSNCLAEEMVFRGECEVKRK